MANEFDFTPEPEGDFGFVPETATPIPPIDISNPISPMDVPRSGLERAARDYAGQRRAGFGPGLVDWESPAGPLTKALSVSPQQVADAMDVVRGAGQALGAYTMGESDDAAQKAYLDEAGIKNRKPSTAEQVVAGAQNIGAGVAGSFADPVQAGAMIAGGGSPALARAIPAAFSLDMLRHAGEQATEAGTASVTGTPFEQAKAYGGLGLTALMAPALAAETVRPRISPAVELLKPAEVQSVKKSGGEIQPQASAVAPEKVAVKAGASPEAENLIKKVSAGERVTNADSIDTGLKLKSVADLDALLKADQSTRGEQRAALSETDPAKREAAVMGAMTRNPQVFREAIEMATDSGSWIHGEGVAGNKYGERPLDWKKNPEVKDWLVKNREQLWPDTPAGENDAWTRFKEVAAKQSDLPADAGRRYEALRKLVDEKKATPEQAAEFEATTKKNTEQQGDRAAAESAAAPTKDLDAAILSTMRDKTIPQAEKMARIADLNKQKEARKSAAPVAEPVKASEKPARFVQTQGPFKDEVLVTKSAKQPGKWQATHMADDGKGNLTPAGDAVYDTRQEAIRSANGETINGVPGAGSKTFKEVLKQSEFEPDPAVESSTPLDPATGSPIEKPAMVDMGASTPEATPSATGGEDVTGIAQRVRKKVAAAGQEDLPPTGKGISPEASVQQGNDLLAAGANPEKIMSQFEQTGRANSHDMAVGRAHLTKLAESARRIEETSGTDSPEYKAAFKARSDWSARVKKMQTEWAKSGAAQQGEADIDTGSFTGLQSEFKDATGKDFTPGQSETAKKIAKNVKKTQAEAGKAQADVIDAIKKEVAETTSTSKHVWAKTREYIEQGITNFDDMRNKIATDLGMSVEKVTKALARSKNTKRLTDEMWRKQQAARRVDQQAKLWVKEAATPALIRALSNIPKVLFSLKVRFHGTVALGTHAPMVAFQPRFWNNYVRNFGKMYKMVGNRAYHEMQVQDLMRRPNYIAARRAGLVNDPFQYEDYNSPKTSKYLADLTGMGNRGYSVLKILRQDMFDQHWNNLPKTAQIPEVAQAIADGVNHATGVVKINAPKGAAIALFAPRLEMSRAAWLATDPIRSAKTFANWKNSSDGEKQFAVNQIKEKAWVAGTMMGMLALNQGFLSATGSDQKINLTDPMHSDWLKFKVAGMNLSYGNAMLSMARLPVRLYRIRSSDGGKLKNLVYPDEDSYSVLGEYGRSQSSPFASLATTLWLKGDWQNRPLPSSDRPVPKRLRNQGVKPYTWSEFFTEQVLPIPAEEAAREVWKSGLGMSDEQVKSARKALATIAVMSATGARLVDDVEAGKAALVKVGNKPASEDFGFVPEK